jgi:hypothetical protein
MRILRMLIVLGGVVKYESSWERQGYVWSEDCGRSPSSSLLPVEAVVPLSVVDRIPVISNLGALPSRIHPPSEL